MKIRFGTRGSALARKQTDLAIHALNNTIEAGSFDKKTTDEHKGGFEAHVRIIKTSGDWSPGMAEKRLSPEKGGKGQFTGALEESLLGEEIDIAVHSLKDVPSDISPKTSLSHFLPGEDERDVFICNKATHPSALPEGAVIGTASLRREALIRHIWPHLDVQILRGNVPTRLEKLDDGQVDGLILAAAGLSRLGLGDRVASYLDPHEFVPCGGQGIIGLQTLACDKKLESFLAPLCCHQTAIRALTERGFLNRLNGSCHTPVGINLRPAASDQTGSDKANTGHSWHIYMFLGDPAGRYHYRRSWTREIPDTDSAWRTGARLAASILDELDPGRIKELGIGPYGGVQEKSIPPGGAVENEA